MKTILYFMVFVYLCLAVYITAEPVLDAVKGAISEFEYYISTL